MSRAANFRIAALALWLISAGCAVGPNYKRPAAVTAPAFKEQPPTNFKEAEAAGWKQSQRGDGYSKGCWWELYNDSALNALEEQVNVSNQNVLQAEAQYRQAKAPVSVARAALSPAVSTAPAATFGGGATSSGSSASDSRKSFTLPVNISWEPDLWGNVHRSVTASAATAQSLAANVGNARLLYQAELAQDYFGLHSNDGEAELLTRTDASYQEYDKLTGTGVSVVERAAFEHAIAILIGKPPADLAIPPVTLSMLPPSVPLGVPSELLERRPESQRPAERGAAIGPGTLIEPEAH